MFGFAKNLREKVSAFHVSSWAMTFRWRNLAAAALLLALTAGCGAEEPASVVARDGGANTPADAALCVFQPCMCGALIGIRRCDGAGQLQSCECSAAPVAPADAAVVVMVGSCPTGRYAGNFEGTAGFLIAVGDVSGFDFFEEQPPLQITLSPASGDEFVVLGNGVMRGNANGTFPFEATIMGKLNCETKQFKATLVGSVQLVLDGIRNDFTGVMESTYDPHAQAFTAGTWTVTGSEADGGLDFGLTGNGSWSAEHERDAGTDAGR